MHKQVKILLIYTGGTIGMIKDFRSGTLKPFNFNDLLKQIPEINLLDCKVESMSFTEPIDSSNMNPDHWVEIAELIEEHYDSFDGFVVLHGSDTMSYTSSALSFMLENLSKPVIFTGSQLPIGDLRTDAKENLITSIQIAALQENGKPVIREVGLYFEYKLYRANRTTKINAEHFQAFSSLNYPPLAESGVYLKINRESLWRGETGVSFKVNKKLISHILLVKMFPGIDRTTINHLFSFKEIKGMVLETYGSGNVTNSKWFLEALKELIDKRIPVVNVTQCSGGAVTMGLYETSARLRDIGVISGKDCTTEAALAKMMYMLGQDISADRFKMIFETPMRGEMK